MNQKEIKYQTDLITSWILNEEQIIKISRERIILYKELLNKLRDGSLNPDKVKKG